MTHPAEAETRPAPTGNELLIVTPVAGDGPRFVTVMLHVRLLSTITGLGLKELETVRSAMLVTLIVQLV